MLTDADLEIKPSVFGWTVQTLSLIERFLKVNIKLHHAKGQLEEGDIFLFNHFARFETFIPQYLIHRETGAFIRSVAAAEFFRDGDTFSRFLLSLGAVPNNYTEVIPFLAAEILRGRKIVVFPEGGMVKDRRVLDSDGRYSVYSRAARERRKHHTGAAVIALGLDAFKKAIVRAEEDGRADRLGAWAKRLGIEDPQALLRAARKETVIVPCNITFYPIRISENILGRGADLFVRGLTPRLAEELLIEGNILLRDTDMDIRLGDPVRPAEFWSFWERWLTRRVARRAESLEELFAGESGAAKWPRWLWSRRVRRKSLLLRDAYMVEMYAAVTVNLSHLASRIVLQLLDRGVGEIEASRFHRALYLAVKRVQTLDRVNLHRSLRNPEAYGRLLEDRCPGLEQLVETAGASELIEKADGIYRFLPKLLLEHGIDEIRIENPIAVYANEVEPLRGVTAAVESAIRESSEPPGSELARFLFDDELRAFRWDWEAFHKPRHEAVNRDETATESGEPFLLSPERAAGLGVLLIHGFTASPAEVRPLGDRLSTLGCTVLGVRLKGHGTSPWDLLERRWEEWLGSVQQGYAILAGLVPRVCLVGFSAGGALALRIAADAPAGLAAAVSVAAPVRFRDRTMSLVPLLHGANVLVDTVSPARGIMLFHHSEPEHPRINYRHMPIRSLYELGQLVSEMVKRLGEVRCPVLVLQGSEDPTVDPRSAETIYERLGTTEKDLALIPSERHGILYEDIGGTHARVIDFVSKLTKGKVEAR